MRRRAFVLAAAGLGWSCRQQPKKVVAVIPKGTSHLFWLTVHAGAVAAGREFGLEIRWNGPPTETEYSRQIQIVDSMIARRVDGIVLAPAERKALVGPVDRAMSAGIPTVIFDSGLDSENYTGYVATNNYEAGRMGARALAQMLGGRGKVAVILHAPGSQSTMERERGFDDVMLKEFAGIHVVARQYGMADKAKAMAAAENILTAHPDLNGMFASTEPSSTGAVLALKGRGLAGKIKFVAFDSTDVMVEDLKRGHYHAMVVQDPFRIGFDAVRLISDKLKGGTPPKRMDLDASVIRADDLDRPEVQQLLLPDLKKYLDK